MSFNQNFYNNFTFQNNALSTFIPPPPPPPLFMVPRQSQILNSDETVIRELEHKALANNTMKIKPKSTSINEAVQKLRQMVKTLNKIKDAEVKLSENLETLSEDEWRSCMEDIVNNKKWLENSLSDINDYYLDTLKKAIAKRSAKRLRLKRVRLERKREKEERIKLLEERSRKIDENLQKIKDDINKLKQEEESKVQADIVLKEVLRKKHDAKKCINKLEALVKLHRARQNTAKGRGERVTNDHVEEFNSKIEKLKLLWSKKLISYEKEESELRTKLKQDSENQLKNTNESERLIEKNLSKWRKVLFGDSKTNPQFDFKGDIAKFVSVRTKWDQFINEEGTPLPIGWVVPQTT